MMSVVMRAVVCLSVWLSVCQVRGMYIPPEMNRTLQNLRQHYKISIHELYNGKYVFSREPLKGKIESKMLFMGGVLETYEKLIGHMMAQLPTPSPLMTKDNQKPSSVTASSGTSGDEAAGDIRSELTYILEKVQELKKRRYQEQMKVLHGLQNLRHIKMDSPVVQSKALFELPWIFEEASLLAADIMRKRRRRRQARVKLHQRT